MSSVLVVHFDISNPANPVKQDCYEVSKPDYRKNILSSIALFRSLGYSVVERRISGGNALSSVTFDNPFTHTRVTYSF